MDLRQAQPASTISGIRLVNQSCAAVIYEGFETLTAVGVEVDSFQGQYAIQAGYPVNVPRTGPCGIPPVVNDTQATNSLIAGMMSWVDTSIAFAAETTNTSNTATAAFATNSSLFLKNVWTKGTTKVALQQGGATLMAGTSGWTLVNMYARGVSTRGIIGPSLLTLEMPTYIDGKRFATGQAAMHNITTGHTSGPPSTLRAGHTWGAPELFPSFESPHATNVRSPPFLAVGDGTHDDTESIERAITAAAAALARRGTVGAALTGPNAVLAGQPTVFFPRGTYAISRPLVVPSGIALVGVAKHLSAIVMLDDAGFPGSNVTPMLTVAAANDMSPMSSASPSASQDLPAIPHRTIIAYISIVLSNAASTTSALHWHHVGGVQRQFHVHRASRCGSYPGPGCANATAINHAIVRVSGAGAAVDIFNFFLEDCCRNASFAWRPKALWQGYLSGPQGPHYRHLLVTDGAGPVRFYHLNCEHGTGEAICEFANGSRGLDVYGFKTEGNTVGLWMRDVHAVGMYGSGGCGCVPNSTRWPSGFDQIFPTMYV